MGGQVMLNVKHYEASRVTITSDDTGESLTIDAVGTQYVRVDHLEHEPTCGERRVGNRRARRAAAAIERHASSGAHGIGGHPASRIR